MRLRPLVVVALVAALALGSALPSADAASSTANPPAGANDWSCRPSAAHPDPVVLVHGTFASMRANWGRLSPKLAAAGYCVFALDYGRRTDVPSPLDFSGGLIPMEESALELAAFVDQVLAATGATKVDIVGHSQGSLMPNYYAKFLGGGVKIGRYVGITPLWDGTTAGGLKSIYDAFAFGGLSQRFLESWCQACPQFFVGSDFIQRMNADGGPKVPGIEYTMLMTTHDEAVTPYTSGYMDGATNIVIQDLCPRDWSEHMAMAIDTVVHQLVLNALDPAHAAPVRCGNGVSNYFG